MIKLIEEMMKSAGVEPEIYKSSGRDWDDEGLASWYIDEYYPDFTPEKQLEIIKLILEDNYMLLKPKEKDNLSFAQALAQLTTELMKAGGLDKKKVKEILERTNKF